MQVTSCKTEEACRKSRDSLILLHKRSFLQYHEVLACFSMPPFLQKCIAQKAKETAPALIKDSVAGLASFCLTVVNGVAEVYAACCQVLREFEKAQVCKSQQLCFYNVMIICHISDSKLQAREGVAFITVVTRKESLALCYLCSSTELELFTVLSSPKFHASN